MADGQPNNQRPTDDELEQIWQAGRAGYHSGWNEPAGRRALYEAGRRAAVDAILAHAERHAPDPSPLRRHLHIAARVASGPVTMQAIADALAAGNYIACRLNDDGTPVARPEPPPCGCHCLACGGDFAGHCIHQGMHPVVAAPERLSCGHTPDVHDEAIARLAESMRRGGDL
jgi:hypothetical protein